MGRTFEALDERLTAWIEKQPMFFVATAPTDPAGHVNVSPKGGKGAFRVLGPTSFAYLDLVGSGVETIAHIRENGRIVVMFCAFDGPPKILRLHGQGRVVQQHDAEFDELVEGFAPTPEILEILRSVIVIEFQRIADSCGFVVPRMELVEERQQLVQWGSHKATEWGDGWKDKYVAANNLQSIDGLTGLDAPEDDSGVTGEQAQKLSSSGKSL
jgi:hypothetical protein